MVASASAKASRVRVIKASRVASRVSLVVISKAGRAATATDPAPLEMFETVINLKPESQWRPGMTMDKLIAEMDKALKGRIGHRGRAFAQLAPRLAPLLGS